MSDVHIRGDIRDALPQRKGHVRTQLEGSHLQAKEMSLGETKPANTLILHFQPPEL